MMKPAISVVNLSKKYQLQGHKSQPLATSLVGMLKRLSKRLRGQSPDLMQAVQQDFWALQGVNFEIFPGERVGVIGRNGAGKSTLLKILSRLVYPTTGEVIIRGRVTSLLEVGTGFNANLSGRENVYLNASLHGLERHEIDAIFKDVVEFSGVGTFLDTPVKHYSSGMRVRLAFSIAAHLDPDILLLDEVLAVGDMAFQKKCLQRVESLTSGGRTILFVSHSISHIIQFCDRVIWLEQGRTCFDGEATVGVKLYQEAQLPQGRDTNILEGRFDRTGTGTIRFTNIRLFDQNLNPCTAVKTGQDFHIGLDYQCPPHLVKTCPDIFVSIVVENDQQQRLFGLPSTVLSSNLGDLVAHGTFYCKINRLPLVPGVYELSIALLIDHQLVDKVTQAYKLIVLEGDFYGTGNLPLSSFGQVCVDFNWFHDQRILES